MIDHEPEEIRIKTYKDVLNDGKKLMGYKGESYMDAGYFYAPYVPLTQTPTVWGQNPCKDIEMLDEVFADYDVVKSTKTHRSITDSWEVSRFD